MSKSKGCMLVKHNINGVEYILIVSNRFSKLSKQSNPRLKIHSAQKILKSLNRLIPETQTAEHRH